MNKQQLYHLMDHPDELNEASLKDIQEVVEEYPYFQAGRMLLIKNLHKLDHIRFNTELKKAAIHIYDRTRLYRLLHDPTTPASNDKVNTVETPVQRNVPESKTSSSMAISGKVKSVNDYFQVDDQVENGLGKAIDFSYQSRDNNSRQAPSGSYPLDGHELFDYERTEVTGYTLHKPSIEDAADNKSFFDWLTVVNNHAAPNGTKSPPEAPRNNKMDIIDRFLSSAPSQKPEKPEEAPATNEDISQNSLTESEELMTETLASIYIKQKHYNKAIKIFEKLGLKYPEKSVYFAQQIKKLQKLSNNQ